MEPNVYVAVMLCRSVEAWAPSCDVFAVLSNCPTGSRKGCTALSPYSSGQAMDGAIHSGSGDLEPGVYWKVREPKVGRWGGVLALSLMAH